MLPNIRATHRYADLAQAEAVLICVPTPLTANREPDLGPLDAAAQSLAQVVQPGQLIVLESTTYPGTTRERLVPLLEASGLRVGEDSTSPSRRSASTRAAPTTRCATRPRSSAGSRRPAPSEPSELYGRVCDHVVKVSTPEAAEMTKLLENIFRSVNIALVNELAMLTERMGIDIWEVVDAASTKPYGFMRFEPGPGMGGHCLPVDPFYLTWRAREFHMSTEFIELAGKINQQMPYHCAERIERALNDVAKPVKGSKILVLGASYKGGVGDIRESPGLRIIEVLAERGGVVSYHDEFVPSLPDLGLESVPLEGAAEEADAVVLVTAHPGIDYSAARRAQLAVHRPARGHPRRAPGPPGPALTGSSPLSLANRRVERLGRRPHPQRAALNRGYPTRDEFPERR